MIISILFIVLITLGIGLPLVLLICPKINRVSAAGLSFPIGIGMFTLLMFFSNIVGIRFSLQNESLILLIFLIPIVFLLWKKIKKYFVDIFNDFEGLKLSPVEKVMLGVLIFLVVTSFINTFYWPVHIWDSVVLYDFRAHVFAQTGFMKGAFIDNYYYGYPLLTSLAHTIVYLAGGKYPQFIHSLFYLSLGVSFYGLLREFVSRKMSLLFTLVLLTVQPIFYHSLLSLTNLSFSVYLSLASICVYLWDIKKERGYLILSALLVGLSTWTRSSEPFWIAILLIVFLVSIYRRKIWNIIIFSLFFFPIREGWIVFQSSLNETGKELITRGFAEYIKLLFSSLSTIQWFKIVGYIYEHVIVPWGMIFPVFIFATISLFLVKERRRLFLIFLIVFTLLGILIVGNVGLSLIVEEWYRIGDAAQRLSMLFYPLFIFCIALVMNIFVKIQK